jgi:hypothetical protein
MQGLQEAVVSSVDDSAWVLQGLWSAGTPLHGGDSRARLGWGSLAKVDGDEWRQTRRRVCEGLMLG